MGFTVFSISDVIKPSGYCPRVLYVSSGILNIVDPLASASNLYLELSSSKPHISMQVSMYIIHGCNTLALCAVELMD